MIAVVHLVWPPLGPAPLERFVSSYLRHPAGADHELVMLFNGEHREAREALEPVLARVPHVELQLEQPGQDLDAYAQAARRLRHDRLCFLNSYSELLADDWLAKLDGALDAPAVGLAGATGSWASVSSGVLNTLLLPNAYRGLPPGYLANRREMGQIALQLERERAGELLTQPLERLAPPPAAERMRARLQAITMVPEQLLRFGRFPNQHLRTNGFIVDRERFNSLEHRPIRRKMDAYLLESGRRSFTLQVQRLRLRTLVVDCEGSLYEPQHWSRSLTLWQGDQERLLIADNQTRSYALGGLTRRQALATFAWGDQAAPRPAASLSADAPADSSR